MERLRTPEGLLEMAQKFRDGAIATCLPEYIQLMNRTAEELEEMARFLETDPDRWETPDQPTLWRRGGHR